MIILLISASLVVINPNEVLKQKWFNLYLQDLEHRMTLTHYEDMQIQMTAHRATLDAARNAAERDRQEQITSQRQTHDKEMGKCFLLGGYMGGC